MKYNINEHNRARVDSLANQIHQVNEEIHQVIDVITKDVDKAKLMEESIKENKDFANQSITEAIFLMHEADSKIKGLKESDISVLSLYEIPPQGLEPLIRCYLYVLAGIVSENLIELDSAKRPTSTDWKACQKLLKNGKEFIEGLYEVRARIDKFDISHTNMENAKQIMGESLLDFEKLNSLSNAVVDIYTYLQRVMGYYDLMYLATKSQLEMSKTATKLEETSKELIKEEEEMNRLKQMSDQLYKELNKATSEP